VIVPAQHSERRQLHSHTKVEEFSMSFANQSQPLRGKTRSRRLGLAVERLEERTVPTLLGQQLFPSDNPWNQKITNAPVAASSAAIMNAIITTYGNGRLHPDFGQDTQSNSSLYGIPYNVVHGNTTPHVHVVIDAYASESDVEDAPIPAHAVLEGDNQNGPVFGLNNRGDSHLLVFDEDNNIVYEFYAASRPNENSDGQWHANQESVWDLKTNTFRTLGWTSADAAGLTILSGLVRPDEGLPTSQGGQGFINHAIRFTLQNAVILDKFLYPASHIANPGNNNAAIEPPMGARFRLKASVDIATLNPQSKNIAQAMKDYGLIVADNGSNFFFSGASYSVDANNGFALTWNDNDIQDTLHGLKSLTYSDFEVVDLTPAVTGLSTSSGPAGTAVTVTGHSFSGAAGHLQVFFGNTPATSVTITDDGHLTAVAPSGAGTVDVRVQSGVSDPNDTSNVNSPLFGYGISVTSPADRFTYNNGTGPGPASHIIISVPATSSAGTGFSITVTALDSNNNTATSYTGMIHFTSSDPRAVLPGNYTFTPADAGVHGFNVTLVTAGSQSITATDTVTSTITGSSAVTVSPAAATHLRVSAPTTATQGVAFSVTVVALDAYGNTANGYRGTIGWASSDPAAVLPGVYTFTAQDMGVHTFNTGVVLKTPGAQSVTATDSTTGSITGNASVAVNLAAPSNLSATAVSSSQINLTWTDNSTGETAFLIERSLDGVSWQQIATVGPNITSYHNTGLRRHTKYYYRVRATSSAFSPTMYSAYSNVASTTTFR
jgi:hypothetical protein